MQMTLDALPVGASAVVTALRSTISDVRVRGEPVANQNAKS